VGEDGLSGSRPSFARLIDKGVTSWDLSVERLSRHSSAVALGSATFGHRWPRRCFASVDEVIGDPTAAARLVKQNERSALVEGEPFDGSERAGRQSLL